MADSYSIQYSDLNRTGKRIRHRKVIFSGPHIEVVFFDNFNHFFMGFTVGAKTRTFWSRKFETIFISAISFFFW